MIRDRKAFLVTIALTLACVVAPDLAPIGA